MIARQLYTAITRYSLFLLCSVAPVVMGSLAAAVSAVSYASTADGGLIDLAVESKKTGKNEKHHTRAGEST